MHHRRPRTEDAGTVQPPAYPSSWIWFCDAADLNRGPVAKEVLGRRLVAFRTESGRVGVLDARCVHMGADLGGGQVVGETIRCPFHHWQFDCNGQCVAIPVTDQIPCFATQASFPATEANGNVYFFNGPEPLYPLPFFEVAAEELTTAGAFDIWAEMPWYMIGINAVDTQHFRIAHDRRLVGEPSMEFPSRFAHRTTCHFEVTGATLRDRLTRVFAGPESVMEMTDWGSTIIFVRAKFRRTETFGLVDCVPLGPDRTLGRCTVYVRKSRRPLLGSVIDGLNARVRRYFIRKFLESDIERAAGTAANPHTLLDADQPVADYLQWLHDLPRTAKPAPSEPAESSPDRQPLHQRMFHHE